MLKVSVSYLEKQKSFIPRKNIFFGRSKHQNKKALFTDSIFREGSGKSHTQNGGSNQTPRIPTLP